MMHLDNDSYDMVECNREEFHVFMLFDTLLSSHKAYRKLHRHRPYNHRNSDQAETLDIRPLLAGQEQDGNFSLSSRAGPVLK